MLNSFRKLSNSNLGGPIRTFIFFLLFYLYLWLEVKLCLIYHSAGIITNFPAFYRDGVFFAEFLSYPGGLVEYISAFLSQFFYYSWAGALVVTLQAWLIGICIDYFLGAVNAPRLHGLRFVPAILLLALYNQYTYHFIPVMTLLTALAFVCLYLKINSRNELLRLAVFLTLFVILHVIAGVAYVLFVVLCVIYELFCQRRWRIGVAYLLLSILVPYIVGVLIFGIGTINAVGDLSPYSGQTSPTGREKIMILVYVLYLFLPLAALGLGLWRLFFEKHTKEIPQHKPSNPVIGWIIGSLILLVAAGAAVLLSYDSKRKALLEIDYYAYHRQWSRALAACRQYPENHLVANVVSRALYHTDRLAYDMFAYPQRHDALFLSNKVYANAYWRKSVLHLELGGISIAEHDLSEALVQFGEHPVILKQMALINMAKANLNAAKVYLRVLAKTLFEADWANGYLDKLELDPELASDTRIQHMRSVMMLKKHDSLSVKYEQLLPNLLYANQRNRMAFEYLMGWYLLSAQLDKVVQNLYRLNDFNYLQIPQLYEEAILLYMFRTKKQVDLHGRQISLQSRRRFEDFKQIFSYHNENKRAAFRDLAKNYGDSYFFYYLYELSGTKK